jgi:hypothetical protein
MTRGAFEKRWTVYGGCLQVLLDNGNWSRPCTELLTELATRESIRKENAFKTAIFCCGASRSTMMTVKLYIQ